MATGKITVTGSMNTNADHAALVAKGDITIHGNGPNSSKFQGLVYSEGSIDIAKTTIMGAAVSKDTVGTTKLEEVKAISVPELTKMDFEQHITLEEAKKGMLPAMTGSGGKPIGILQDNGTFTPLTNEYTESLKELGAALGQSDPPDPSTMKGKSWSVKMKVGNDYVDIDQVSGGAGLDARTARNKWGTYVLEHKENEVKIVEIFEIDLNTLISLDVDLEMMFHTTVVSK